MVESSTVLMCVLCCHWSICNVKCCSTLHCDLQGSKGRQRQLRSMVARAETLAEVGGIGEECGKGGSGKGMYGRYKAGPHKAVHHHP